MAARKAKGTGRGHAHGVDGCDDCKRIFDAGVEQGRHLEWSAVSLALDELRFVDGAVSAKVREVLGDLVNLPPARRARG